MRVKYNMGLKSGAANAGYESEFENDAGIKYTPRKDHYGFDTILGVGKYSKARLFQTKDATKSIVVLDPAENTTEADYSEVYAKANFFQKLYPSKEPILFESRIKERKTYRLILPFIKGVPLSQANLNTPDKIISALLSVIRALQHAHSKNIIVLDLTLPNILYNTATNQSYLIDGGLSAPLGEPVRQEVFQVNQKELEALQRRYYHLAPECWSIKPTSALAQTSMDVFSFHAFVMLLSRHTNIPIWIMDCFENCNSPKESLRPTLDMLASRLHMLQSKMFKPSAVVIDVGLSFFAKAMSGDVEELFESASAVERDFSEIRISIEP